jgi:hypothetical protein
MRIIRNLDPFIIPWIECMFMAINPSGALFYIRSIFRSANLD